MNGRGRDFDSKTAGHTQPRIILLLVLLLHMSTATRVETPHAYTGRMCAASVTEIMADETGRDPADSADRYTSKSRASSASGPGPNVQSK